ncbi:MAG: GNAT family N-acetyltransferase [Bacilli bacterium]|jgi:GNAT superfamily N-acetyltransferase
MITIKEVTTKRMLKKFINYPLELYKDSEQFSPYIYEDEIANLTEEKNPAFEYCDFKLFLAYKDDEIVGRICGIISHFANEKYNRKRVRFNRIDMIDDIEVTKALLNAVADWGKENGMTEIVGPLGYSDQDKEGLLIEGFEYHNMFATFYQYPYYHEHLVKLGFVEDAVWNEHRIQVPKEVDPRWEKVSNYVLEKYDFHIVEIKNKRNKTFEAWIVKVLSLVNRAYNDLYGYVPIKEDQMYHLAKQYKPLINIRYLHLIADKDDNLVAFGLSIPSPIYALKKIKGRLYPFGFISFLRSLKNSKHLDMLLVAVEPSLQNTGLANVILFEALKHAVEDGIEYAETGPQLETNKEANELWKRLDYVTHKKRAAFVREIGDGF